MKGSCSVHLYYFFLALIVFAAIVHIYLTSHRWTNSGPNPLAPDRTHVNDASIVRLDHLQDDNTTDVFVVVIRTFRGYLPATRKLLKIFDDQILDFAADRINIHVVLVSTDWESFDSVYDVAALSPSENKRLRVSFMNISQSVYNDNCCQVDTMCKDERYHSAWVSHVYDEYYKYKASSIEKKFKQFCFANNLLHYVLTDMAMSFMMRKCPMCKYITVTNGDNTYDPYFVSKTVALFRSHSLANTNHPVNPGLQGGLTLSTQALDIVQIDYLERGTELVKSSLIHSDLGAFVYSISSLMKFGVLYVDTLPEVAWPDHYYGADSIFIRHLVSKLKARVFPLREALFTHW